MEEPVQCQLGLGHTPRIRQGVLVGGICPWVIYVHAAKERMHSHVGIQSITIVKEREALDVQVKLRLTMIRTLFGNYKSCSFHMLLN